MQWVGAAAPVGDNPYHDQGGCAAGTRQRGFGGVDCSSLCSSPHPGMCVGWEARLSPQSDALVERVSGAGHGSHSHLQEKLGQKLFLEKSRVSSFPSSSQARGGEVMEHWAGRRTCLRLGVIPSPGPQPVLTSAGGEFRAPTAPPAPLSSRSSHHILGQPRGCCPAPGAVSASQRRARLCAGNQPQMWRSSCCWRAPSGDGQGLGTPGRQKGPVRWPGPQSQELLGALLHLSGASVLPAGAAPTEGVTGTRRGSPVLGAATSPGVWHSLRGHGAIPTAECHPGAVFWEAGSLSDRSQVPIAVPPPSSRS